MSYLRLCFIHSTKTIAVFVMILLSSHGSVNNEWIVSVLKRYLLVLEVLHHMEHN